MANQGNVGNQKLGGLTRSTSTDLRMDGSAALVVVEAHGRYQEPVYTGSVFGSCNQAARTITTLSTTVTGFCLTNPVGSGKNLVILDCCIALATATSAAQLCYAYNASATAVTQTTAETVRNMLLLGNGTQTPAPSAGVGLVARAATTPTAGVAVRAIGGGPVAASTIQEAFIADDVAGKLILSPGAYLHLASVTNTSSAISSMLWEEVPLAGGYSN